MNHPLTCVALLELGRLASEQGKYDAALTYLHEATISAAHFERRDVLEEAFSLAAEAYLLAGRKGAYPGIPAIAAFGRVKRYFKLRCSSLAEQLTSAGSHEFGSQCSATRRMPSAPPRNGQRL